MQFMSCRRILSSLDLSSCEDSNLIACAVISSASKELLSEISLSKKDKSCSCSRAHFLSRSLSWESEST
ncbi:hypothetical protein Fmac_031309 [Flemingia macrophylla]|uniref:Uncharacterized protein n=1 Tax=Flemingia macrophylla TaxID=520843 RepID=A0ABD1L237_9FABA